jgi:hypothetical protein
MDELGWLYATGAVIVIYFLVHVGTGKFDPFAPMWLYLVGYLHLYVVQAFSYHDWAVSVRGAELVTAANFRAFWALLWIILVYHLAPGKSLSRWLPAPPSGWSSTQIALISPPLVLWGLLCAGVLLRGGGDGEEQNLSPEASLFRQFPFVMMVAAVLLIVTGRTLRAARPQFLPLGLLVAGLYVVIWMFNGKRSHSLIGVLATVCAYYTTRLRRPSWPVLFATGFVGMLVVAIAIGWRNNLNYERSLTGFANYLGDFEVSKILVSLDVKEDPDNPDEILTHETSEYGGFLLMMDTVPAKSDYDYCANYLRVFSTFIPRIVWPSKPIFGRDRWIAAWVAGSEMEREDDFAGPAIGILGATQLNGGWVGTLIVLTGIALLFRTAYEYFLAHGDNPWVQFTWSISYYNAWFMVVNDDPLIWFYYNWGFTTFPIVVLLWLTNRRAAGSKSAAAAAPGIASGDVFARLA